MKYGVWSEYFTEMEIEDKVKAFLGSGFTTAELSSEDGQRLLDRGDPSVTGSRLKEYAKSIGFSFPQGHLELCINICTDETATDRLKRWLDLFGAAGIKACVLHSGKDDSLGEEQLLIKRVGVLRTLTDYIKDTDMCICLENLRTTTKDCKSLLEIIDAVNSKNIGICLDTGHLVLAGGNHYEFIKEAGDRLCALHIADNDGSGDQHLLPYGIGTVNLDDIFTALKEISYGGMFNFEIPGESSCPHDIRVLKLRYIKDLTACFFEKYGFTTEK